MQKNNGMFLTNEECKELFENKEIYVFGAGMDAEEIQKRLSKYTTIRAYIDNYRGNTGILFCGKPIIELSQCLEEKTAEQPILVCTKAYAMEICKQLLECGLKAGIDYFVWDDRCVYHYNDDVRDWITFCKKIWTQEKRDSSKEVLIPFSNTAIKYRILTMYYAQHFAEKFNASICGYTRHNAKQVYEGDISLEIYKACNVDKIICMKLTEEQEETARQICDNLWNQLHTWEDWKNINIYGINLGASIVSNFLRRYVPSFDLQDEKMYTYLNKCVREIVFWYEYINTNDIKVIFLDDGVTSDGFIRDIAITKGIPVYVHEERLYRLTLDWRQIRECVTTHFKELWEQLSVKEQEYGLKWAERQIAKRLQGGTEEMGGIHKNNSTFAEAKKKYRILADDDKIKVIIFPHIFEEFSLHGGWQIFDDNYFSWLCHLGELSEKTPQYDWYVKLHPAARQRDNMIIDMIIEKYPRIKRIPSNVSPLQLKEEGAKFALTVSGTIGHEFPEMGIQVINAGNNPHIAYDFTWNPKTKDEYDDLIMHLDVLNKKIDIEDIYKFYCLDYLYYDWEDEKNKKLIFENELLVKKESQLKQMGMEEGAWMYREFMNEWTWEKQKRICSKLGEVIKQADNWKPNILYKKEVKLPETF